MIDGCDCVSPWSWMAVGCVLGVVLTLAIAELSSVIQFRREEHDE